MSVTLNRPLPSSSFFTLPCSPAGLGHCEPTPASLRSSLFLTAASTVSSHVSSSGLLEESEDLAEDLRYRRTGHYSEW